MPETTRAVLVAEPRQGVGKKSALRALRRAGQIPASLYGHGEPVMIRVPARAVQDFLKRHAPGGLLDLDLGGQRTPAVIRELDRDPITGEVMSLGFQRVDLSEEIHATVPIQFAGEETLIRNGYVLQRQLSELEVKGRAAQIPEVLLVDLTEAQPGDVLRVRDLSLPPGVRALKDPDLPVATISAPTVPADVEAALESEEAAREALRMEHGTEEEEEAATAR